MVRLVPLKVKPSLLLKSNLTKELSPDHDAMREETRSRRLVRIGGHRDHLQLFAHTLYYVVAKNNPILAYFFDKRSECAIANPTANLHMVYVLDRLLSTLHGRYPHLDNGNL
ncbi:hypothetical protein Tco_1110289 [Tanacetum coccineum]|uniref:Uncharacterized protein n=1 Tax=Tanacetum coccineum TaxID=301880 RepID=A0ABQ5IID0_9ASTR